MLRWLPLLLVCAACGSDPPQGRPPAKAPEAPLTLEHDFGVIPHGERRSHEFPLDLRRLPDTWVPLRVHLDCSCGHADLRLRKADGSERYVDASGSTANLPRPDETMWLHVTIDTANKEALDLPHTTSRGFIVLQLADDLTGSSRVQWPLQVRFGIDAPVELRPVATLDFGRVPVSGKGHVVTTICGDTQHADATFGPAVCDDPAIAVELERDGGLWRLRATCTPDQPGNHRASIRIANTIPGYQLALTAVWKVVADLEAKPVAKVTVRTDLAREQTAAEATTQYCVVVDHAVARSPEFQVLRCVDDAGHDIARHFAVSFEPIPESPREQRLMVRYLGGLSTRVRGSIVLSKDGERGPFLPIELVVFGT